MNATIGSTAKNPNEKVKAPEWPKLVAKVAREHQEFISKMRQGNFYDNIDVDPRDSLQADEKVDLKSLKQYKGALSSQKTSIRDDKVHVRPVDKKADKHVDKMIQLARAAK